MEYLQELFEHIRKKYNFNNIRLNCKPLDPITDALLPSITFDGLFSDKYNVKFTISYHPGYDVPCLYFQIYQISIIEDQNGFEIEREFLTFDNNSLNFILRSHQKHLIKNSSCFVNSSMISAAPIDLFSTMNNTYFYIHPCQLHQLVSVADATEKTDTPHKFVWIELFLAVLGIY